jgi:hypothetical protein
MLRTYRSLEAYCATLVMKMVSFLPCNGAQVEWNWQGKTEVLGEKPVPVPLCPPQIPHGLTRDQTRASVVRGWRLTAWAIARPNVTLSLMQSESFSISHQCCWVSFFWDVALLEWVVAARRLVVWPLTMRPLFSLETSGTSHRLTEIPL